MQTAFARVSAMRLPFPGKEHWATSLVLATMLGLYLLAGLSVTSIDIDDGRALAHGVPPSWRAPSVLDLEGSPPVPEPLAFQNVAPQDAMTRNAAIPVSTDANPAAKPFVINASSEFDRLRSLDCLTAAVYYEAAIEMTGGQRAVAQVVLNRLRHPAFPKTVCGVVFQGSERSTGCQFTFTCDGAIARAPSEAGWKRARKVAEQALAGQVYKPVGYATHYHTNWVVPYWSSSLTKVANVGTHIFYRWEGGWGRPAAFRNSYAGVEPVIGPMRRFSSGLGPEGDENALLAADADLAVPMPGFANRAVVRRYEPLREQAAAGSRAELAKAEVPMSLRWALTGDATQPSVPTAAKKVVPIVVTPAPVAAPKTTVPETAVAGARN